MRNRRKQQKLTIALLTSALVLVLALIGMFAVKIVEKSSASGGASPESRGSRTESTVSTVTSSGTSPDSSAPTAGPESAEPSAPTTGPESEEPAAPTAGPESEEPAAPTAAPAQGAKIVCIDPGHETTQITDLEPIAPGSSEMKQGVTTGTQGVASGKPEYQVNLEIGLILRDMLRARGYEVVMTRETNDVTLSNVQRAQIAAAANADIFVRLHCNGVENPEVNGVLCFGPTETNPYLSQEVIAGSRRLCTLLRDSQCAATGQHVMENLFQDNMTGINWAAMPVAILEMGFMSNAQEDLYMASAEGQQAIAAGIANGVDAYFAVG